MWNSTPMKLFCAMFLMGALCAKVCHAQTWSSQVSGTAASLRGVSAVNARVVWASGSAGTWLRTIDGGASWQGATVPGAAGLDFRGVRAIDEHTAYLMSSGPGDQSRVYGTSDDGAHWTLVFTNPDPNGFFDAIAFWDERHGILAGDPVDGRSAIFTTDDAGRHWLRRNTPPALPNEGSFAASNSCLFTLGKHEAWLATGGSGHGRVFYSSDGGRNWAVSATPVRGDGASSGIFSLAFSDGNHGIAVGGDYAKDTKASENLAVTTDGGRTWKSTDAPGPNGFRSAVAYLPGRNMWLATGTSGSDISIDNGKTWKQFDSSPYNALGVVSGRLVWAVGPKGRIATLMPN
jgi:photosystem II stability/assembly factor-like uncharacterized protein